MGRMLQKQGNDEMGPKYWEIEEAKSRNSGDKVWKHL